MQRAFGVALWLGLYATAFCTVVVADDVPQWALETFVDVTAADGDVLQVELRRHCCHGIAETTQRFCVEFKIPTDDCVRLDEFVQQAHNPVAHCVCEDAERPQLTRPKLSTASVRVLHTGENRTQSIKLAVHEGDLAVLDSRVDELCERLELDPLACGNVRAMLRDRSMRDEMNYHKTTLLELASDRTRVEQVVTAIETMMRALLEVNGQLRDEITRRANVYADLVRQAKRERHALERRVRELEYKLQLVASNTNHTEPGGPHQLSRALTVTTISPGHRSRFTTTPTFAHGSQRIPRVHVANFSYAQYLELARQSTPVIIQGLLALPGSPGLPRWSLQSLLNACGDAVITLKRPVGEKDQGKERSAMMWAGIEAVAKAPLRHFIRDLTADGTPMTWPYGYADLYLHDASIQSFCPQMLQDFTFPRYFTDDRLQLMVNSKQSSYWPSLFIGGASTTSALHVDWASTAAWMGLLSGRKHWAIAKPSAKAALHELVPTEQAHSQGRFNASLLSGASGPLLYPGELFEDVLEAGEVLFIPADCPHQVQNLEQTIAVAANFVDSANMEAFAHRMRVTRDSTSGDQSGTHAHTLRQLADHAGSLRTKGPAVEPVDLTYAQFKALSRPPTTEPAPALV